ncbi:MULTISPECIES: DMT family transporter [Microbacterium]|uniref:DMT family transporter n=1 Tax=Microbacterium TaxID=33882 RepID=UPI001E3CC5AC|nr:DMT family transporter [Microbacterium nymphoidis]MCD2497491.1 DMT family transporter [Microbacterium nymphoidis]
MLKPSVLVAAAATIVLYALNYVLSAVAVGAVAPFLVLALRWIVIAIVLWTAVLVMRIRLPRGRALRDVIGVNVLTQGAQFIASYWALGHGAGAGIVALVIAMNPVMTAVATSVILRRRQGARVWWAVAVGAAAVTSACVPKIVADARVGSALAVVILALLGLSLGSLWQGERLRAESPIAVNAIGACVGLPLLVPFLLTAPLQMPAGGDVWGLIVVIGLIGAAGTTCYSWLVRAVGAGEASIVFSMIPAVTAVIAWAVIGEEITAPVVVGLVLGALACLLRVQPAKRVATVPAARWR